MKNKKAKYTSFKNARPTLITFAIKIGSNDKYGPRLKSIGNTQSVRSVNILHCAGPCDNSYEQGRPRAALDECLQKK